MIRLLILYFLIFICVISGFSQSSRERDSIALVDIYIKAKGNSWDEKWEFRQTIDKWEGVKLNTDGSVKELNLRFNNLTGTLSDKIGDLLDMKTCNLSDNNLTGTIPKSLENLTNLEYLFLNDNNFTGDIEFEFIKSAKLIFLSVSHNNLTGNIPPSLVSIGNLQNLSFWDNNLNGTIPTELYQNSNISSVDFRDNNLTGSILPAIGNMTSLSSISLSNNSLEGNLPVEIGLLQELRSINFSNNKLTGNIPSSIGNLPSLQTLLLDNNNFSGAIPPEIGNLDDKLWYCHLNNNNLSGPIPSSFSNLTHLWEFFVNDNNLSGCISNDLLNLCYLLEPFSCGNFTSCKVDISNNNGLAWNGDFSKFCNFDEQVGAPCLNGEINDNCECTGALMTNENCDSFDQPVLDDIQLSNTLPCPGELVTIDLDLQNCDEGCTVIWSPSNGEGSVLTGSQVSLSIPDNASDSISYEVVVDNGACDSLVIPFSIPVLTSSKLDATINLPDVIVGSELRLPNPIPFGDIQIEGEWTGAFVTDNVFSPPSETLASLTFRAFNCDSLFVTKEVRVIDNIDEVAGNNTCRERDSLALVALYNATDGPNWTNTWKLDSPINTWFGVSLNNEGCIKCLDLDGYYSCDDNLLIIGNGNGLNGFIPDEIWQLDLLEYLSLSQGLESDLIMQLNDNLLNFKNLKTLLISGGRSNITGFLPKNIDSLKYLERIVLPANALSDSIPSSIGKLRNLRSLSLRNNSFTGEIPSSIGDLNKLIVLDLTSNKIHGDIPNGLWSINSLERIGLSYNSLTGNVSSSIKELSELRSLGLSNNSIGGSFNFDLSKLTSLTSINLSHNNFEGKLPLMPTSLKSYKANNNRFSGCFPDIYHDLCYLTTDTVLIVFPKCDTLLGCQYDFRGNEGLPWGGDFERFCNEEEQTSLPCNDGNPESSNDIINQDCECIGTVCTTTISEIVEEICEGDSINIFGNWISNSIEGEQIMSVDSSGCSIINTVTVTMIEFVNAALDTFICSGELISINGFDYNELGIYEQLLSGQNGCDSLITISITTPDVGLPCDDNNPNTVNDLFVNDCICQGIVQTNAFTPDGDGDNDLLRFTNSDVIENSELWIYNRWGDQIYKKENYTNDWDGGGYPDGVYYYILKVGETVIKSSLTILR